MTATTADNFNTTTNEDTSTSKKTSKKQRKERKLSGWGAAWRFTSVLMLFIAATIAIVIGIQYGVSFIAGLGLAAIWISALQALVTVIGYLISLGFAALAGLELTNILNDRYKTKAEADAKAQD